MLVLKSQIPSVLVVWLAASSDEVKVLSEVVELSTKHQRELMPLIDTSPLLRCWKITQKYLRQTNSDSRRVLTVGLSDVRGLWASSMDAVVGWADWGGGAEVELSDGPLSAVVPCSVEDWWGGLGILVMRGSLFPVTQVFILLTRWNDLRPAKNKNKNWTDVAQIDFCHFFYDLDTSWCSERGSLLTLCQKAWCFP